MNNINILDCTLRDGGYINDWKFGEKNIIKIIKYLSESKVDIIECGFLKDQEGLDFDSSIFDEVDRIHRMIPNNKNSLYVAMVNVGEYDPKYLSYKFETKLDGIRIAFHKKDKDSAFKLAKEIAKKRYKVFLQPMVSLSYTDKEFIDLIEEANKLSKEINLFAFYIVDSFGAMKQTDLLRLYHLVDNNLNENIYIGYHAHNNSQLAFSNAQSLVELRTKRKLIIDSSIYGMGRGAGNLNTELFIDYLNEIKNSNYTNIPILKIIDEILFNIYLTNPWGYSLPHYLSANNNCHPNYATYLNNKNTLTIEDMSNIISQIKEEKKNNFDKAYIEDLYNTYQSFDIDDFHIKEKLKKYFNKKILLLFPGSSTNTEHNKITKFIKNNDPIIISINFKSYLSNYIFISNKKRFESLSFSEDEKSKLILTSNLKTDIGLKVDYNKLINKIPLVEDNSGMMLIKLLIDLGKTEVYLAGLDGYSHDLYDNFIDPDFAFLKNNNIMDKMNIGINKLIKNYSKNIKINFITTENYIRSTT